MNDADEVLVIDGESLTATVGQEESGNIFSRLFFCWTNSLVGKGVRGELTSCDDLLALPDACRLSALEQAFHQSRTRRSPTGWAILSPGIAEIARRYAGVCKSTLVGMFAPICRQPERFFFIRASRLVHRFGIVRCQFGQRPADHSLQASARLGGTESPRSSDHVRLQATAGLGSLPAESFQRWRVGESAVHRHGTTARILPLLARRLECAVANRRCIFSPLQRGWHCIRCRHWDRVGFFAVGPLPVVQDGHTVSSNDGKERLSSSCTINQLLIGYSVATVKFGAFEADFEKRVELMRREELKYLKRRKYLDAVSVYIWAATSLLMSTLTFLTYVLLGGHLTASKVFTSLSLLNVLIAPLINLPWILSAAIEACVSKNRLSAFLNLNSLLDNSVSPDASLNLSSSVALKLDNVTSSWQGETESPTLRNINLTVQKGELIGICGSVGSGKSSLFYTILQELHLCEGSVFLQRRAGEGVGYACQDVWLRSGTIRENITFGKPFQNDWYWNVVDACCLAEDFQQLSMGDQTTVGEEGQALSGGQRARVALARTVYQDLDIYLLDDPLSAVDALIAEALFDRCIRGMLRDKTVLLVTHRSEYLIKTDRILTLNHGRIVSFSPPQTVPQISEKKELAVSNDTAFKGDDCAEFELKHPTEINADKQMQMENCEAQEIGLVKFSIYKTYCRIMGYGFCLAILLSLFSMQASRNASDWWLSYWLKHANNTNSNNISNIGAIQQRSDLVEEMNHLNDNSQLYFLTVYSSLAVANSIFVLIRAFVYAYGCLRASERIHSLLMNKLFRVREDWFFNNFPFNMMNVPSCERIFCLQAPLSFFLATPKGRILNRISTDMFSTDESLPSQANRLAKFTFELLGAVVLVLYSLPWCVVVVAPLCLFYWYIQNDTLPIETIVQCQLVTDLRSFCGHGTGRGHCARVGHFRLFVGFEFVVFIPFEHHRRDYNHRRGRGRFGATSSEPSSFWSVEFQMIGLALTYVLLAVNLLAELTNSLADTERDFVSTERLFDYIRGVASERQAEDRSTNRPAAGCWPSAGHLQFRQVCLRYSANCKLALDAVTFDVNAGEKVAIVGRTAFHENVELFPFAGSGKSSLLNALFRMYSLESGQILIDSIDIASVDLYELRNAVCIIPQNPFLFSGSLAENLDIRRVLERDQLEQAIRACELGICPSTWWTGSGNQRRRQQRFRRPTAVDMSHSGFDFGKKGKLHVQHLLWHFSFACIFKIICIDEATAHVDVETDARLQRLLRRRFAQSTVLTIAHRLCTVMDSDRIIVMENGQLVEQGNPAQLLSCPNSKFRRLAANHNNVQYM
ncbi:putative ABC transporter, ATP-binding protein [Trichinella spiralis]|uniref:putative ABC transporter, ATP-binding protein n=1 Tax=Trichinella spiralis TaxID=6334 RepID=UPI0001EFCE01|nr:putative ABC transporter, ATP-binding protein [Trichinella spiralis]